jgi:cytidylate kinase
MTRSRGKWRIARFSQSKRPTFFICKVESAVVASAFPSEEMEDKLATPRHLIRQTPIFPHAAAEYTSVSAGSRCAFPACMNYRVLTISREYGSGGSDIAAMVAESLGWRLLDDALLDEISRLAKVPISEVRTFDETIDPWICRLMRPLWGTSPDGISPVAPVHLFDADEEAAFADRIIRNAWDAGGCVVVGRGAQCVLRYEPDVFHVFVYAGWEERIKRVRSRHAPGTDLDELLRNMDERRLHYVHRHYGSNRLDPHLYDLMVNCNNQPRLAAQTILTAMNADGCGTTLSHGSACDLEALLSES